MESNNFESSPLIKALQSRGLTIQTFAAMAEKKNYTQSQAFEDLSFLAAGGDPGSYLKLELLSALTKIGVDFFRLREALITWGQNLPFSKTTYRRKK